MSKRRLVARTSVEYCFTCAAKYTSDPAVASMSRAPRRAGHESRRRASAAKTAVAAAEQSRGKRRAAYSVRPPTVTASFSASRNPGGAS